MPSKSEREEHVIRELIIPIWRELLHLQETIVLMTKTCVEQAREIDRIVAIDQDKGDE